MIKTTTSISLLQHYAWLKTTLFLTSFCLVAFWTYFYLVEARNPNISVCYISHENAFVMPDLVWIVGLLLLSYHWLKKSDLKGIISSTAAGGALVFLALIDISYNCMEGMYLSSLGDGLLNGLVNILSLGYGITLVILGYKLLKVSVSQSASN